MNKNKQNKTDLDYLSDLGYEKGVVTDKDVNDINSYIDSVSAPKKGFNFTVMFSVIALFVVGTGCYVFVKNMDNQYKGVSLANTNQSDAQEINAEEYVKKIMAENNVKTDVVLDTMVVTANKVYPKEHFTSSNVDNISMQEEVVSLSSKSVTQLNDGNLSNKIDVSQLPNAPIVYIEDLKIANYQLYYYKGQKTLVLINGGLRAQYDDANQIQNYGKDKEIYTADAILRDALKAFNKKDYTASKDLLNYLLNYNSGDVNAQFYTALCYYNLKQNDLSLKYLEKVLNNNINVFSQEAEWYKALTYIQKLDYGNAEAILKQIVAKNGFYKEQATAKLKDL